MLEMKRSDIIKAARGAHMNSSEKVPNNSGKKYFKWNCMRRMLLLTECLGGVDIPLWEQGESVSEYLHRAKKYSKF